MTFFIGLHHPSTAWPFARAMLSVQSLLTRQRDFRVNEWILDSAAFSQLSKHGRFLISKEEYLRQIERWQNCGNLMAACTQDWMCEAFVLEKTGLTLGEHQDRTIESYLWLRDRSPVYILPVLQGFEPGDYIQHLYAYAPFLEPDAWVGVGSVCKRNSNPDAIEDVLLAIKRVCPRLRLHGFGLKITALERPTIRALLDSSDSMAWSDAARKEERPHNDPREALRYCAKVQEIIGQPCFVQDQLFQWWREEENVA